MAYTNTTLLGLNQPTTGQESGVWGDDVNNGFTQLVDLSVAGTNNITQDSDITLAVTNGNNSSTFTSTATNSTVAQYAVLNCTGSRTAGRNIIVPALSKLYVVYNNTTGGFSITVKKSAGTGVTIAPGEKALCYYDNVSATDVIKVLSTTTLGTVTTGTWNASVIGAAYGGTGVANNAANTITFTGNYSLGLTLTANTTATLPTSGYHIATVTNMAANPVTGTPSSSNFLRGDGTWSTVTGTVPSPYTANGVVYASSTSALATGSGLQFDGTNLGLGATPSAWGTGYKALQIGDSAFSNYGTGYAFISQNALFGTSSNTYINTAAASYYRQYTGTHAWFTAPSGTAGTAVTFTQAMTLNNSGYLGIGTSNPTDTSGFSQALDLNGTSGAAYYARTGGSTTNYTLFGNFGADGYINNRGTGNVIIYNNNAERVRITSTGGFSVGTTADPGAGAIYATGNITAYYSSDAKFKENIQDIPDALGIVTAIGSKTFDWTDEYLAERGGEDEYFQPKQSFGVIAQDVQKVFPQAVRTREDGSLAVDYEKLAILSFGAIGQLLKRVEALESK